MFRPAAWANAWNVAGDGSPAWLSSYAEAISGDGRYVTFDMQGASNLVPGGNSVIGYDNHNIYVRDRGN